MNSIFINFKVPLEGKGKGKGSTTGEAEKFKIMFRKRCFGNTKIKNEITTLNF